MKLKTDNIETVDNSNELKTNTICPLYKKIIQDRLNFIKESIEVIEDAFTYLFSDNESDN